MNIVRYIHVYPISPKDDRHRSILLNRELM